MMTNAEKIQEWRNTHPDERITAEILRGVLNLDTLQGADLQGADLRGADLRGADLQNNTSGSILQIFGLYPYPAVLTPTPEGWQLRVGCWHGTVAGLRKLAALDDGWPEAIGEEILRRRPLLYAIADMCDAHIANHQGLIERLAERWENQ